MNKIQINSLFINLKLVSFSPPSHDENNLIVPNTTKISTSCCLTFLFISFIISIFFWFSPLDWVLLIYSSPRLFLCFLPFIPDSHRLLNKIKILLRLRKMMKRQKPFERKPSRIIKIYQNNHFSLLLSSDFGTLLSTRSLRRFLSFGVHILLEFPTSKMLFWSS